MMERLTSKDELGYFAPNGETLNCLKQRGRLVDRLATYEDTGLTPDEIVKMGMSYEDSKRYSKRLEGRLKAYEEPRLRELVKADKEGARR